MRLILNLGKWRWLFESSLVKKATHWTTGTLNRTENGEYVFYADYDLMKKEYIHGELKHLQHIYDLGNIHIFESSPKSFHAISFVKLTAKEYIEILMNSSCCQAFLNVPRFSSYRNWVLRHFSKGSKDAPKYLYTIKSTTNRKQSLAHYNFLKTLYPVIEKNQLINSDGLTKLDVIDYPTAKA